MSPKVVAGVDANSLSPAATLLTSVPADSHIDLLKSLIASLQPGNLSGIEFVAFIVLQQSHKDATQALVAFMETAIEQGHIRGANCLSQKYPLFGRELFDRATEAICKVKSLAEAEQSEVFALQSYLSFVKSIASHIAFGNTHSVLLGTCLHLMGAESSEISMIAKDVVFSLLSIQDESALSTLILSHQQYIWRCIEQLTASSRKRSQSLLGYSLWLRWALAGGGRYLHGFITDRYWEILRNGLRRGDPERRKLCLNILKLSVAADSTIVSNIEREQHHRYCTVFETIVLSRYINQVQECKKDLDFLATNSSVPVRWLYTLLASALDRQIQESNRKFIGNWVMQSGLRPTAEFIGFLTDDFLPWAMQGHLFVSTLHRGEGELRCLHGDRLSSFVKRLMEDFTYPEHLANVIVDTIRQKRNSIFAYAVVYLLEGLQTQLKDHQIDMLQGITSLPEVARDYVAMRANQNMDHIFPSRLTSRREILEQESIARCCIFNPDRDSLEHIWNDLEYLEYPKKLLMIIPEIVLNPRLAERALENSSLAIDITHKLTTLRKLAETKTYLFSPLVLALRSLLATVPAAVALFKIENFVIEVADSPPEPTIDLMLEEATLHLTSFRYDQYFGERLSYGFAAFIDMVSRLHDHQNVLGRILKAILQPWKDQKVPPPVVSRWKTSLQLQMLLLCFEQYNAPKPEVTSLLEDLFHILSIEPLPGYRYLLEWIIVRLLLRYRFGDNLLQRLETKDHHSNSKHLASLMKIGTIIACDKDTDENFTLKLATSFIPLAASSKVIIRHEAQWQFPVLMDHSRMMGWTCITENPAFGALDDYIRSLERFRDPPLERQIDRFDPLKDHTITNLVDGPWYGLDPTVAPLTNRKEFVKLYRNDANIHLPKSCMPLGDNHEKPALSTANSADITPETTTVEQKSADEVSALQTKGAAYLARAPLDPSAKNDRNKNLIVVGSLVDNPYNLGGLSRVAEIFGASALCLPNHNVISNKDFTSVSVSSHLHFPIVQLPAPGLPAYLMEKKRDGFIVVGVEQTDRSIILGSDSAQLPEKMVLIVGSEKEGIPAIALTDCDLLVEIPQKGITRSLNVQTAVSIVLYEHARPHR